jgi:hypothetical protein
MMNWTCYTYEEGKKFISRENLVSSFSSVSWKRKMYKGKERCRGAYIK